MKRIASTKLLSFRLKERNDSGIILVIVLFILVILTILAVSLGRNAQIELALTKHAVGKMKARNLAFAGVMYSMDLLSRDADANDTLYLCGISADTTKPVKDLFENIKLQEGSFTIAYQPAAGSGETRTSYGFQDEERKLNINAVTTESSQVFVQLLLLLDVTDEIARQIVYSIIDWIDADSNLSEPKFGAENDYYQRLKRPYHCKNLPFDSTEELLLVAGVTEEIYNKLSPYITVIPKAGGLKVNLDTAPALVLKALMRAKTGPAWNTSLQDADSLVDKILTFRKGDDGQEMTRDDRLIDQGAMSLNQTEGIIFLMTGPYQTKLSNFFRITIEAKEENYNIRAQLEAVVKKDDLSIVSWKQN